MARELISRVQRMRKEAGFAVSDRITLIDWQEASDVHAVDRRHREWIADEVLATDSCSWSSRNPAEHMAA